MQVVTSKVHADRLLNLQLAIVQTFEVAWNFNQAVDQSSTPHQSFGELQAGGSTLQFEILNLMCTCKEATLTLWLLACHLS